MRLIILAVTKMHEGRICVAGINECNNWVRPVRKYPDYFQKADLFGKDNKPVFELFNIVDVQFLKKAGKPPHYGDYLMDAKKEPVFIGKLSNEKAAMFLAENEETRILEGKSGKLSSILKGMNRSLALIGPVEVNYAVFEENKNPRIRFEIPGIYETQENFPCTDLKFRAFGKALLKGKPKITLSGKALKEKLNTGKIYLAIGLAREWKGDFHAMVVGVHTAPDYAAKIAYEDI